MTAEVAVMNRLGVAIAADSAITIGIGDNSKTYYTQQKIFSLSRKHSVGIMVYNDAEFMDIYWEILINEFSKKLGDNTRPTLKEYADYFLAFLRDFVYIDDKCQKKYLGDISWLFFSEIKEEYDADVLESYKDQEVTKAQQGRILAGVLKKKGERLEKADSSGSFVDDGFVKNNQAVIIKELDEIFADVAINEKAKEEMIELFLLDLEKIECLYWPRIHSGIVFSGYGDEEIFPSIIEFTVFGRLGKCVLHDDFSISDVIHDSSAWINPFAQAEVINTFIRGMAPRFKEEMLEDLDNLIEEITKIAGTKYAEEITGLKDAYVKKMQACEDEDYTNSVMAIVGSLPTSNLAEMAEALVNLTALRQNVSTEEQTVGGPTDVALITKTDGFVWIKKKQIFQSVQDNRG